jgi:hypothetical protein
MPQVWRGSEIVRLTSEEQAALHLQAVLPKPLLPHESIEVRCLFTGRSPAVPGPRAFLPSVEEAVEFALLHRERWDVFFGIGPRFCPQDMVMDRCSHGEKGADHVARLGSVWGDFDVKAGADIEEILERLSALSFPPTVVVASGKGLHCYWPLVEPTNQLSRVEAVNRSMRIRFGADNAVDAARILRVAGTLNFKYGEPLPVRLLRAPGV